LSHFDDARIAAIANGASPTPDEEGHLAECRNCAAVYGELVHLRIAGLTGDVAEAPTHILAAGHQFITDRSVTWQEPRRRPGFSSWRRGLTLRVAPALVAVAVLLILVGRGLSPDIELPGEVRLALVERSTAAGQVHPLVCSDPAVEKESERGSGQPGGTWSDELRAHVEADQAAVGEIAAYVASLQISDHELARLEIDAALHDHPDDETLLSLDLYQLSLEAEVDELEARLKSRLETHPDDGLARLNLAILYHERGDDASLEVARDLVRDLAGSGDSVIETRAARILGTP
jgi:hypothetical protein